MIKPNPKNGTDSKLELVFRIRHSEMAIPSGSIPIITKPTPVTDKTLTTIDHIITNDATLVIQPGILGFKKPFSKELHHILLYHFIYIYTGVEISILNTCSSCKRYVMSTCRRKYQHARKKN